MINHIDDNNNDAKNDVKIVGTDFFTDSESFLNELTDDQLDQVIGGNGGYYPPSNLSVVVCANSQASILQCQ